MNTSNNIDKIQCNDTDKYILPIAVGLTEGNGIVAGDLFITAGHVAASRDSFTIRIENEDITLDMSNRIILIDESAMTREDGLFSDVAIYKLPRKFNNIRLAENLPELRKELHSISYKHKVISSSNGNFFSSKIKETYILHKCNAVVKDIIGNFIICEMSSLMEPGRSGSPIIIDNQLYGILNGGDDGKICFFQSSKSILDLINNNI